MRPFLFRLVPPRPCFPGDATPDEMAVMAEHVAYWQPGLADGTVVAMGPVDDPAGTWGLGVLLADDLAAAQARCDTDPAVRSGLGFRMEVLAMHALLAGDARYDA